MMLIGMTVSPDVFSTRNMIWASVAVSFSGFSSCSSCMALSPSGVAALSRPSIFAAKFMIMEPCAGVIVRDAGEDPAEERPDDPGQRVDGPALFPTRIRPSHRVSTPVRPSEISNPVLAMSNVALTIAVKISVSPSTRSFTSPRRARSGRRR
jgi:hypothetical protein